jgi:DNA-binding transcriptional LysR family regulator
MVNQAVDEGRLQRVLDDYLEHRGSFWMLWPGRHTSTKVRVFIDHMCAGLFPAGPGS